MACNLNKTSSAADKLKVPILNFTQLPAPHIPWQYREPFADKIQLAYSTGRSWSFNRWVSTAPMASLNVSHQNEQFRRIQKSKHILKVNAALKASNACACSCSQTASMFVEPRFLSVTRFTSGREIHQTCIIQDELEEVIRHSPKRSDLGHSFGTRILGFGRCPCSSIKYPKSTSWLRANSHFRKLSVILALAMEVKM